MDNYQAAAYAVLACKHLKMSREEAERFKGAMLLMFDLKSEEEAEKQSNYWLIEPYLEEEQ